MIICQICKKEYKNFLGLSNHIVQNHKIKTKDYYDKYLKKENEGVCLTCKKETSFQSIKNGYLKYCSIKCANIDPKRKEKIRETNFKKYGGPCPIFNNEIKNKIKETNLKKNIQNINRKDQIIKKRKQTFLKKYGVENISQLKEIKELKKKKSQEKFGTDYPFQSELVKQKSQKSIFNKYGVINVSLNSEIINRQKTTRRKNFFKYLIESQRFLNKVKPLFSFEEYNGSNNTKYKFQCKKCNNIFYDRIDCGKIPRCLVCYPLNISKYEIEIQNFIKSYYKDEILINDRKTIFPKELDIYIPKLKIAFEFDGLYWHSYSQEKNKNYHLNKTIDCLKQNIFLIHIFEDEWINKRDIVEAKILSILGLNNKEKIFARECNIKIISCNEKNNFLENFHLQGKDISSINLGAFYGDTLVSVMTFSHGSISKGRKNFKDDIWELNRFCSHCDFRIVGIASKLLEFFKKNYEWKEIYSYADRRWSNGNVYKILNFNLIKETKPNYWYVFEGRRFHRFQFRKNNIQKLKNFNKNLSEQQNMLLLDYDIIYDCGNLKFQLTNK